MGVVFGARVAAERETRVVKNEAPSKRKKPSSREPHRVRLPGIVIEEDLGLGDAIKSVTYRMGIAPCGGCQRRAAALNRWIRFTR